MSSLRVVVVGAGFGGVRTALDLAKDERIQVTVVADHSHFRYYPALYHAATGGKRAGSRIRLGDIFEGKPIHFVQGTATKLDRSSKHLETKEGKRVPYDVVVFGLGSVTNYFGIKGLEEYSYGIKSSEQADRFKKHLHDQFIANGCPDLNYIIVGGGPTGIELAGALPAYLRHIMRKHNVKECKLRISLIEAAPRLLPRSPKDISRSVRRRLRSLGVTLYLGKTVEGETADTLMVDGKPVPSHTVVWTAGVANNPFFKANNFALNPRGKVTVNQYLQAEPDVYVLGDNADTQYSGLAQTALRDGIYIAHTIIKQLDNLEASPYAPKAPITVIPVGPHWASVQWGKVHLNGWLGWILRMAADLVAFHDIESWPKASAQWLTEQGEQDDCPTCSKQKDPLS